eukprot:1158173-Pelagomonas_calceolata.AAC.6
MLALLCNFQVAHEYMGCLSLNAPCHEGLDLSQCLSAGALHGSATAAGAICPSCMGGSGSASWPNNHLK